MMFKVMLTGASGLLGQTLSMLKPEHLVLQAYTKQQLDITQAQLVKEAVQACKPDVIINAAAYTQVDKAESESEKAYAVNRDGALYIAQSAAVLGIPLLHISTDYVFDGIFPDGICRPYTEIDEPNPLNKYGASKLAGERAIQGVHRQAVIVRSSSLFSSQYCSEQKNAGGKQDFFSWVLSQGQREEKLKVLDSWVSCPTPVKNLALVLWQLAERAAQHDEPVYRLWHYAGTSAMSRYEWAKEIVDIAKQVGLLKHDVEVQPCLPEAVVTQAKRPLYSVLDCRRLHSDLGIELKGWHEAVGLKGFV